MVDSAGIGIVGLSTLAFLNTSPLGIILTTAISRIRSCVILVPVVSRSKTQRGFLRFSFMWCKKVRAKTYQERIFSANAGMLMPPKFPLLIIKRFLFFQFCCSRNDLSL